MGLGRVPPSGRDFRRVVKHELAGPYSRSDAQSSLARLPHHGWGGHSCLRPKMRPIGQTKMSVPPDTQLPLFPAWWNGLANPILIRRGRRVNIVRHILCTIAGRPRGGDGGDCRRETLEIAACIPSISSVACLHPKKNARTVWPTGGVFQRPFLDFFPATAARLSPQTAASELAQTPSTSLRARRAAAAIHRPLPAPLP